VKASSKAWKLGEPLKNRLDRYNNGMLCAPARDSKAEREDNRDDDDDDDDDKKGSKSRRRDD
jgi:hypothetical protein